MLTFSGISKYPATSSSSSLPGSSLQSGENERIPVSLKQLAKDFKELPDDLQEKIISRGALVRDLMDCRKPSAPGDIERQMLRLRLLGHSSETAWQDDALLRFSVRKNLKALFRISETSDIPGLLTTAIQARNDQAFSVLLGKMTFPLPPDSLKKTLQCAVDYGQPEKLEQLLAKQREASPTETEFSAIPSLENIKKWIPKLRSMFLISKLRSTARAQQNQIQRFRQLPADKALHKLLRLIETRGKGNSAGRREIIALLQKPDLLPKGHPDHKINCTAIFSSAIDYADMTVFNALLAEPCLEVGEGEPCTVRALHLAAIRGHLDIVKTLLELPEVNINVPGGNGETPLHYAVIHYRTGEDNRKELVKMLLCAPGVDVNQRNRQQKTPLGLALRLRSSETGNHLVDVLTEMINLLQEHGASK